MQLVGVTVKPAWGVVSQMNLHSVVVATDHQVSSEMDGEFAILEVDRSIYYGVRSVAARIWSMVQTPIKIKAIQDRIRNEYQVAPEPCRTDLFEFLGQLRAAGLIEVRSE
jgi:Coenzyme PQQ synthesis protein D (PqqD)